MTKSNSPKNSTAAKVPGRHPNAPDAPQLRATSGNERGMPAAPDKLPDAGTAARPKTPSKQDRLAALVVRDEGATLDQMVAALGWLPHTTRAALTGLKKKGFAISSDKVDGVRTYRAVAPQ